MWELDCEESWVPKNSSFELWCWRRLFEGPLDFKEIQPVHPNGNQSWVFIGRTDAEAEIPILWPPDEKSWLIGKDSDAGRDWGQEEKGTTEDKMAGWHHQLDGHEFGWTLGVGDGQGGLACCNSWGHKESDATERLNWTELNVVCIISTWGISTWGIYWNFLYGVIYNHFLWASKYNTYSLLIQFDFSAMYFWLLDYWFMRAL